LRAKGEAILLGFIYKQIWAEFKIVKLGRIIIFKRVGAWGK